MRDYSSICYSKTFLNQVIIRIDFHQILPTETIFHPDIEKSILQEYPRRRPDQLIRYNAINVIIDPNQGRSNANSQSFDGIQREYRSSNEKNKLLLSNRYIIFEINEYKSFDEHMRVIKNILSSFYSKNKFTAVRIGVRYINIFDSSKIKIQKNFFSTDISSVIYSPSKGSQQDELLLRSMHLSEYLKRRTYKRYIRCAFDTSR